MPRVSGDGFVTAADGKPRWGKYGAAGVLVRHVDPADGEVWYFLARRSEHTHRGGTWAMPGGALDLGESPVDGALREFHEEIGTALTDREYEVAGVYEDDHGGWSYWTVLVDIPERFPDPKHLNWETSEATWFRAADVPKLELFPEFRRTFERLAP